MCPDLLRKKHDSFCKFYLVSKQIIDVCYKIKVYPNLLTKIQIKIINYHTMLRVSVYNFKRNKLPKILVKCTCDSVLENEIQDKDFKITWDLYVRVSKARCVLYCFFYYSQMINQIYINILIWIANITDIAQTIFINYIKFELLHS